MEQAKIAVLLSTYNGGKYIKEFLSSLRLQKWNDITLIVRDDGSTDNTLQILHENNEFFNIKILWSDRNIGSAQSFFLLLKEAGAGFDYYAFADQDDVWLPEKMSRAVSKLGAIHSDKPVMYCSGVEYVDKNLNHLKWYSIPNKIGFGNALVENVATGCTIVINNSARALVISKLPEKCLMHDWWIYLVLSCFGTIFWDDYSGIKYRQHDSNTVGAATTFLGDMKRRIDRFFRGDKNGLFSLSSQAAIFYQMFEAELTEDKKAILELIIRSKSSVFRRMKLICSDKLWRQRAFDNLIMRLVILMNRY